MTVRFPRKCALLATSVALTLSACSGGGDDSSTSTPPTSPATGASSTSGSPSTSTKATGGGNQPAPPAVNPLTGHQPSKNGVVAVKIDDTGNGRPQVNIDKADNVYIEQVEAGLTRLLAVYNTTLPTVEPVRSTRASDPELVAPYGKIGYATSGGAYNPLKLLHQSDLKYAVNDAGAGGFTRDGSRYAPYNLKADLAKIAKNVKAPKARYIGRHWSYDTAQISAGKYASSLHTTVGSTPIAFSWSKKLQRYVRVINGSVQHTAAGNPVAATNVLVQFCKVRPYYKDIDVNGNASTYTETVGSGKAVLYRNAHRIVGTWTRKYYHGAWTFETTNGKPMLFRPGNVWTVLVSKHALLH